MGNENIRLSSNSPTQEIWRVTKGRIDILVMPPTWAEMGRHKSGLHVTSFLHSTSKKLDTTDCEVVSFNQFKAATSTKHTSQCKLAMCSWPALQPPLVHEKSAGSHSSLEPAKTAKKVATAIHAFKTGAIDSRCCESPPQLSAAQTPWQCAKFNHKASSWSGGFHTSRT